MQSLAGVGVGTIAGFAGDVFVRIVPPKWVLLMLSPIVVGLILPDTDILDL
jgi:hypothetical protein